MIFFGLRTRFVSVTISSGLLVLSCASPGRITTKSIASFPPAIGRNSASIAVHLLERDKKEATARYAYMPGDVSTQQTNLDLITHAMAGGVLGLGVWAALGGPARQADPNSTAEAKRILSDEKQATEDYFLEKLREQLNCVPPSKTSYDVIYLKDIADKPEYSMYKGDVHLNFFLGYSLSGGQRAWSQDSKVVLVTSLMVIIVAGEDKQRLFLQNFAAYHACVKDMNDQSNIAKCISILDFVKDHYGEEIRIFSKLYTRSQWLSDNGHLLKEQIRLTTREVIEKVNLQLESKFGE